MRLAHRGRGRCTQLSRRMTSTWAQPGTKDRSERKSMAPREAPNSGPFPPLHPTGCTQCVRLWEDVQRLTRDRDVAQDESRRLAGLLAAATVELQQLRSLASELQDSTEW